MYGARSRGFGYEGYTVDPEALHDHATRLTSILDRFTALAEASQSVTKTEGAFGAMFADWMEPLIDGKHEEVHPLIADAAAALESHIAALRECAESYDGADADVAATFDSLEGDLA